MRWTAQLMRVAAVTLVFALLTGLAIAPLSLRLNSEVPGTLAPTQRVLDYYHFHWDLWWLRYAALEGRDIWYTDKVLAPFTHNLTYHSLTASLLPFALILTPLLGHLRAANALVWLFVALTGALFYAYLRGRRISPPVALLGGIALAYCPYMLDHAGSGHLNLLTVWWLPIVLFAWEQTERTGRSRWALLTGAVLWGMWFTDTLIVLWGGLLLGPAALFALLRARDRRARARIVMLGTLALIVTVALAWACGPLRQTLDFDTTDLAPARLLTLRYYSLQLSDIFPPRPGEVQRFGTESDETLGLLLVLLTAGALFVRGRGADRATRRARWFWLWAALPALILTLGPDQDIFGVRVPLPFRLVHWLFDGQMRTPLRFLPPATAALILFLVHTYDPWLRQRWRTLQGALVPLLLLGFVWDYGVFRPYPSMPALQPYPFHWEMRAEDYPDYNYVVVDVPSGPFNGWRDLGSHPEAMVYGITHQKRQVSGLLSRIPLSWHLFYEQDPLFGWLTGTLPLDRDAAAAGLVRYVDEWPIGYLVVHMGWLAPERLQEALAFFNAHPALCYVTTERDAVLYRTTSHPKGCSPRTPTQVAPDTFKIALGEAEPGADLQDAGYVGEGWYPPEDIGGERARWAGGRAEALLHLALPADGAYTLTLRAMAFAQLRTVKVVAGVLIDGAPRVVPLGALTIAPGDWQEVALTIPADFLAAAGGRTFTLSLAADGVLSPAELGLSEDARPLTLAYDTVTFARVED